MDDGKAEVGTFREEKQSERKSGKNQKKKDAGTRKVEKLPNTVLF